MKPGVVLATALLFVSALAAQNRTGFVTTPGVTTGFGSVLHPGGTSAMPGIQRTTGNILHPAGGGPQIAVPGIPYINPATAVRVPFPQNGFSRGNGRPGRYGMGGYSGGYAVYVPDYSDQQQYYNAAPQQQPVPPVTIIVNNPYPPAPPAMRIFDLPGRRPLEQAEQPADQQASDENEPVHYMLAFKDHSVYAAIAYWVDGDTLHYFTEGNTHNQASLSLVDRELTNRLNKGTGVQVNLPALK
jgi:hypothetical protein